MSIFCLRGKQDAKRAAVTGCALETDLTAHRLAQYADGMQSDTTAVNAVLVFCAAEVWFEDMSLVCSRYAGAVVLNDQFKATMLLPAGQVYRLSCRAVFDRVVDQS